MQLLLNTLTRSTLLLSLSISMSMLLTACETNPAQQPRTQAPLPPKTEMSFADLAGFDRDLGNSLAAPLPTVQIAFYDRLTPSAIPERLQRWMAAVEAGGGKVTIKPPPSTVSAKSPFALLSAASSIYSASKMIKDTNEKAKYKAAEAYNAEIQLKTDDKGDSIIDKVVFAAKPPAAK
jgi:hypothetical protein